MPNPRKPTDLKVLQGTDRPDRANPDEPKYEATSGSAPPDWLDGPEAVKEWGRIVAILEEHRVLTAADLSALGHLCNLHAVCVKKTRLGGGPTAAELTQLRLFYTEFGLTPASRSKVSSVGDSASKSKYAGIGKTG